MTYQNNNRKDAISQIQSFLRTLLIYKGKEVGVPIDGIYGNATANAVKDFQKENGLPQSGTIDKTTYDLLYKAALDAEFEMSEPLPLYVFANGRSVSIGEQSDFVMLLQILLNELKIAYDGYEELTVNGVFDEKTEAAIKEFQTKNRLSPSGIVDKRTWNALVESYNKHINNSSEK